MRSLALSVTCAVFLAALCAPADAKGTARVAQIDGTVQVYPNVAIRVVHQLLKITTNDGKGTLVISRAACSFVGELQECLPYTLTLYQSGKVRKLPFGSGIAYFNSTGSAKTLPHSTVQIPPHGMVMNLKTKIGTRLLVTGILDQVTT